MRPASNRRPPITSSLGSSFFDKSSSAQQEKNFPTQAPFSNELPSAHRPAFHETKNNQAKTETKEPDDIIVDCKISVGDPQSPQSGLLTVPPPEHSKLGSLMTTSNTDLICSARPSSCDAVTCLSSLRPAAGPSSGLQGNNSPSRSRSLDRIPPAARAKAPIEEHASVTPSPRLKVNIDTPNLDTTPSDSQTSSKPVSVASQPAQSPYKQTLPYPLVSATDLTAAIEAQDPPSTSFNIDLAAQTATLPYPLVSATDPTAATSFLSITPITSPASSTITHAVPTPNLEPSSPDHEDISTLLTPSESSPLPKQKNTPDSYLPTDSNNTDVYPTIQDFPECFDEAELVSITVLDDFVDPQLAPDFTQASLQHYDNINNYLKTLGSDETKINKKKKKKKKKKKTPDPTSTPDNPVLFYV
ncbi:hypothetical protein MJO28_005678 [Puccinia striiformis f. sp. tritici]|uniref:Uncharacterized protein n=1 Tax=Puccinia striiformis f. sp. tritici TaxID=168172 RepID=A0ACC0EKY3_9BASI|nr:hypothetical protein MJO28_005678 [Puccinia striiformis f. sp. tritici]